MLKRNPNLTRSQGDFSSRRLIDGLGGIELSHCFHIKRNICGMDIKADSADLTKMSDIKKDIGKKVEV